jgi:hypothetical protein
VGADRASTLANIDVFSYFYSVADLICPDTLCNEVIVKQRSRQNMEKILETFPKSAFLGVDAYLCPGDEGLHFDHGVITKQQRDKRTQ